MCVKKRRWADKDLTHTRLGYRVFQMFYELNTAASKPKSQEDFIRSQYYEGFTKFGRSCIRNEYLHPEKFAAANFSGCKYSLRIQLLPNFVKPS